MIKLIYHEAKAKEEELLRYGKEPDFTFHSMPEFSKSVRGLNRKKLVIVGARPSNAKTSLALQWAWDISRDHSVLFFSLESDTTELIIRLFCNVFDIDNQQIEERGISYFKNEFDLFMGQLKERRFLITDNLGSTWVDVMKALEDDYRFDVLFLDYIQCVSQKGMTKLEFIEEYIKQLRVMAIKHNFCAVVLSQINRQNVEKDPRPTMTGLKNAGFLEEHADKCFLLHWDYNGTHKTEDFNKFEIILAKNKSGRTGISTIKFFPERYKFADNFIPRRAAKNVEWVD